MTARREAFEEIGLPMTDNKLPAGYSVEHLTELPANLAMTELGVRPCVAYLKAPSPSASNPKPDTAQDILPRLDAREVAAVFTAPFQNFLHEKDLDENTRRNVPGEWYRGSWHSWHETAWRMHQFFVPVTPSTVFLADQQKRQTRSSTAAERASASSAANNGANGAKPSSSSTSTPKDSKTPANTTITSKGASSRSSSSLQPALPRSFYAIAGDALAQPRYRVFGMTARIIVDCARVAYGFEPEYEHNSHFGDEEMIAKLLKMGRLNSVKKEGEVLTREVMTKAANVKL